jgi:hypothetical protein
MAQWTRRKAVGILAGGGPAAAFLQSAAAQTSNTVSLDWLGGAKPGAPTGVSWGVPWPRGTVRKDQAFRLTAPNNQTLPLQTWPLAYWPDGSLKWSGFTTVTGAPGPFQLARVATAARATSPLTVTDSPTALEIDTGKLKCRVPKQGAAFIESMTVDGRIVARAARLICTLEDRSQPRTVRLDDFTGTIRSVTAEQTGPIRATIKIEGVHKAAAGPREWLPFTVRLYFHAGQETVRLVHTIVFDGDDRKDFIRGLGLTFTVPMREQAHNRHVRFSGEGEGLWSEPLQPLTGRRVLNMPGRGDVYADQLAGKRVPNHEEFPATGQNLIRDWAIWDSYKLTQPNADGFTIQKRTNPQSCWLDAGAGRRASGLAFVGDVSGGLAVAVKNFWQSFPASLEVENAATAEASLHVWLWSPDAPAMDLRHYDTKAHGLEASYEDVQPGFSTPNGVARTSELTLYPTAAVPTKQETAAQSQMAVQPPLLACTPQYLHSVQAFGIWSLPDRSKPALSAIEDQLDGAIAYYQKEIEQRRWYGFWNYGDIMHTYDTERHAWRYDIGGFAWDNTELASDMWLWYSFLRTGRADIFRMAEAMTRHTSEVDTYHSGRFAGLGSRHNVRHWGCGAKEARIGQAAYRRYYYYLTTDERTGDIMHESVNADYKATEYDPMRLASPLTGPKKYPGRVRGGPDWLAFAGNWMTEWERTGNTKYRDKIVTGMDCIAKMPYGFMTGPNNLFGYDPATGMLYPLVEDGFGPYNLATIMGGGELVFELNMMIDHAGWRKAWLQFCRLGAAPKQIVARDNTTGAEGADGSLARPDRTAAYAYLETKNPAFARQALSAVIGRPIRYATRKVSGPDVLNPIEEVAGVSTNSMAQSALNAIEVLEMCRDRIQP